MIFNIDRLVDKLVKKITNCSPLSIVYYLTLFVLSGSVPIVYLITSLLDQEYTKFLFILSIVLPLILTPAVIFVILKLASRLKHVDEYLQLEIEKNKEKDLLLFEQARFAFMGEMIANISHQWKQPLNTVSLAIVSIKASQQNVDEDLEKKFDIMEDNINYLASTINDFMSFFDNKSHSDMRELNEIIKEIKSIIITDIKNKNIEFQVELDLNKKDIKIASSISQVLLNLINNSKDSCMNGKADKIITLKFIDQEDYLALVCCDSGENIDKGIKDKMFDPYFTTKPKNKGTGIGLYMSKQIVQKVFNGDIVYKEDPKCFYVEIPYSDKCIIGEK